MNYFICNSSKILLCKKWTIIYFKLGIQMISLFHYLAKKVSMCSEFNKNLVQTSAYQNEKMLESINIQFRAL